MLDSCHPSLNTILLGKLAGVKPGEAVPVLFQFDQSLSGA